MKKRSVYAPNGSPAMGPYCHAAAAGNLLFVSGQGPFAKDGSGTVSGTFEEETRRTLDNLKAVVQDAGSSMEQVVKVNIYLKDIADFGEFNGIYAEYFPEDPPARTCIQAGALPAGIQIEIEAVAIVPDQG
jgi:2-iminobutanoate/2-iminopropanoate deaminase